MYISVFLISAPEKGRQKDYPHLWHAAHSVAPYYCCARPSAGLRLQCCYQIHDTPPEHLYSESEPKSFFWPLMEALSNCFGSETKANQRRKACIHKRVHHSPAHYLILLTHVLYPQGVHGSDHGLHGSEYVLINQLREALSVFVTVTRPMDNSHLLDKGAFATFTGS